MKREIISSKDGSHTLCVPEMDETYHSIHGALTESRHVFIKNGVEEVKENEINVFEVGFGTGLNAMTSLEWLDEKPTRKINYDTIEAFPVSLELINQLNYSELFDFKKSTKYYSLLHDVEWGRTIKISEQFSMCKIEKKLEDYMLQKEYYDCIYFDAFAPNKQHELWSLAILKSCFEGLKIGGRFVTYCAKGQLKRDLKSLGFEVVMVPGPPGKREMTTAIKRDDCS